MSSADDQVLKAPLDDYVTFVRDHIAAVLRFIDRDQQVSIEKSVRALVGEASWAEGRRTGKWNFQLTHNDFDQFCNVRMRGIFAFSEWKARNGIVAVRVSSPTVGIVRDKLGLERRLEQAHLQSCNIGNVSFRESNRTPDAGGAQVLYNASPIVDWTIEITTLVSRGTSIDDVEDLLIQFQFVAQAVA